MARRAEIEDLLDLELEMANLVASAEHNLLEWVRWTPPQDEWLRLDPPTGVKLFRAGNQAIGKTWAQMQEVDWRARGAHPHYRTRAPPVEIWVVCTSWAQSVAIQKKFWTLAPKDRLTARTRERYTNRSGWGKDTPVAEYINGSIVRFRTTNQGAEAQAGATIDYVAIDEPPDEEVYRELRKRVERRGGQVGLSLTPVNRPCGWLQKLVDDGMIDEVHARLEARNLIPLGTTEPLRLDDGTIMDQAWIDHQIATTPAMWAPVILHGEWEAQPQGVFFKCFDVGRHVTDRVRLDPKRGPIFHVLGFDYATADRAFGHCASLCQVQQFKDSRGRTREAIYVLDEVALGGTATSEMFAQAVAGVTGMLERNGLRWHQLHAVHGDNPVTGRFVEKSNLNTMRAIASEIGVTQASLRPRILNAKDDVASAASMGASCQYVYERIASGNMLVHPRCEVIIKGLSTWDYTKMHPYKDAVDAVRYALKPFIFSRGSGSGASVLFHGNRAA